MRALIAELRPDVVAIERVLFQVNVRTAMSVGQAAGWPWPRRPPPAARSRVLAQRGQAGRRRLGCGQQATDGADGAALLGIGQPLRPVDAADAMALALCHLAQRRSRAPTPRPTDERGRTGMIGSLRGTLLDRSNGELLVEVGGVGYRVQVGPVDRRRARDCSATRSSSDVHHHVREDAETLYGFATSDERDRFEALLGAHGVGPSLALAILSVHPPMQLRRRARADDVAALCLVPGVGKKTAARLLVELKSRLDVPRRPRRARRADGATAAPPSALADVRDALANLGYGPTRSATSSRPARRRRRRAAARRRSSAWPSSRRMSTRAALARPGTRRARRRGRPAASTLDEFVGQAELKEHLASSSAPPAGAGRPPTTCCSPARPGLGKTTLADIVAAEMERRPPHHLRPRARARRRPRSDPHQARRRRRAVHRRDPPAGPRRRRGALSGDGGLPARHRARQGPGGTIDPPRPPPRSRSWAPPPRTGLITGPLRDRFGLVARLDYYEPAETSRASSMRAAGILDVADRRRRRREIARRSRGTPRIANRLLRRVRDFAEVHGDGTIDAAPPRDGLAVSGRRTRPRQGRPCRAATRCAVSSAAGRSGLSTLAIAVGEPTETVEDVYEPFLIQQGLLMRTPRAPAAWEHLGLRRRPHHVTPTASRRPGLFG